MLDKRFVVMCGYVPLPIFGRWQIFLTRLLWTEASGVEVNLWSVACVSWNNRMEMTLKPGTLGDWCIPEVYQLMRVLQLFMWNFIILTLTKKLWGRWCLWIFFQVRVGWRGGCRILVAFALTVIYRNFMQFLKAIYCTVLSTSLTESNLATNSGIKACIIPVNPFPWSHHIPFRQVNRYRLYIVLHNSLLFISMESWNGYQFDSVCQIASVAT